MVMSADRISRLVELDRNLRGVAATRDAGDPHSEAVWRQLNAERQALIARMPPLRTGHPSTDLRGHPQRGGAATPQKSGGLFDLQANLKQAFALAVLIGLILLLVPKDCRDRATDTLKSAAGHVHTLDDHPNSNLKRPPSR